MFPMSTMGGGATLGFPDVCNTPTPAGTVPVPYPCAGDCAQANGATASQRVRVQNKQVLTVQSVLPSTHGDEAGSAGGVTSGTFAQQAAFKTGSTAVLVEGAAPAMAFQSVVAHNGPAANAPVGAQLAPSQTLVVLGR